jgi:hypothetical protein
MDCGTSPVMVYILPTGLGPLIGESTFATNVLIEFDDVIYLPLRGSRPRQFILGPLVGSR